MKIGLVTEISTLKRNQAILEAITDFGHDVYNLGMSVTQQTTTLSYIHTAVITALLHWKKAVDLVIGGCGTGQGFMIAANQFPGVQCGHITSPLDAWLFVRINAGNTISLALNQGYGWAGDVQLSFIFSRLFAPGKGEGYPVSRQQPQQQAVRDLEEVSNISKRALPQILADLPAAIIDPLLHHQPLIEFWQQHYNKELRTEFALSMETR